MICSSSSGVTALDTRGEAVVPLPWHDAEDLTYQLTCLNSFAPVFVIEDPTRRSFRIAGGREGVSVSWTVRALRVFATGDAQLPPRIRATLDELVTGASDKEIALRLGISPNTVHQYVKSLLRNVQADSRLHLVSMMLGDRSLRHESTDHDAPAAANTSRERRR